MHGLRIPQRCTFSRFVAYDRRPDQLLFVSSHADYTGVCLTRRFIPYTVPRTGRVT